MYLLIVVLVLIACSLGGVWIARTRGRSMALGIGLGMAGPIGWFTLSALPSLSAEAARWRQEEEITRVEDRLVRTLYWPTLLTWALLGIFGISAVFSPALWSLLQEEKHWLRGVFILGGVVVVVGATLLWGSAISILLSDQRLPESARGPWAVALLFGNLVAAFFFHPWRYRMLHRQRTSAGA
jgi:hypothetical protein